MIHLNDLPGFHWAIYTGQNAGLAKACIGGESFWLRDVKPSEGDRYIAKVDNVLMGDIAELVQLDNEVTFCPFVPQKDGQ